MLCSKGYRVQKTDAESDARLVEELTVEPRDDYGGGSASGEDSRFVVCMETERYLYLPRCFGLSRFGPPKRSSLNSYEEVDLRFSGDLLENQVAPVEAYLRAAEDPLRMGGILQLPPGYGKTVIALYLLARLRAKTLILVHKEFLMNQWIERVRAYLPGCRVGIIKQKQADVEDKDVVIGLVQSVSMRAYDPSVFAGFGMVVVDECHHVGASVFSKALPKVTFRYALGLSATVVRKDGLTKVFKWFLGDVIFKVARKTSLACEVRVAKFVPEGPPSQETAYGRELVMRNGKVNMARMVNVVAECEARSAFVVSSIVGVLEESPTRNVIVLSDRRQHLERLCEALRDTGLMCGLYVGGMSNAALEESKACKVILGTYSMVSEGFDLARLDTLVLATSKSDVEQSVGRIQRKHSLGEDDNVPVVIDVVDDYSVFANQFARRLRFYKKNAYTITS